MSGLVHALDRDGRRALKQSLISIRDMSAAIREMGDKDLRTAMVQASRTAAQEAVPYVQKHVPVNTGVLQKNIKAVGTRTQAKLKAGTPAKGGPYAWYVHGGHRTKNNSMFIPGVPDMRKGVSAAFHIVAGVFLEEQRKVADRFNRVVLRKARVGKVVKI